MDRITFRDIVVFLFWLIGVALIGVLMVFQVALVVFPIIAIFLALRGWQQQRQARAQGARLPWYRQSEIILALGLIVGVAVTYWMKVLPEQNYDILQQHYVSRYDVLVGFLIVYSGLLLRALFTVSQRPEVVMTEEPWSQRSSVRIFRKDAVVTLLLFFCFTSMIIGAILFGVGLSLRQGTESAMGMQIAYVGGGLLFSVPICVIILVSTFNRLDRKRS